VPDEYRGLDRFEARKRVIVADINADGLAVMTTDAKAEIPFVEAKKIMQPFGDRSHVVIEPMLTDQWFADAKTLARPAIASVREGDTKFVPKTVGKDLLQVDGKHPALVHLAPAVVGPPDSGLVRPDGEVFVAETEEEAAAAARALRRARQLTRDEDVLDTWFSSALWPFSTLGWPEQTAGTEALLPDQRAGHRLRHHLLLGRPDDDDGPAFMKATARRSSRSTPSTSMPWSATRRAEDVEVEGQRHRSAGTDRRIRRRRAALHAGAWPRRAAT
jgi:hypothetical protein